MDILIATKNPGKFTEIAEILGDFDVCFLSLKDLGIEDDFEETGATFEENALGKARFYAALSGLPTVSDDSGLFVEALKDELGLKTRRWGAGESASDEDWLNFFMERMLNEQDRRAKFVCAAAIVSPDGEHVFLGETCGYITREPETEVYEGIPLSSVFKPEGCDRVYTALSVEEKNRLSHRGAAFAKLISHLIDSGVNYGEKSGSS